MARKTLVVGLGGTGCKVVQQVKLLLHEENPDIRFVGIDTDENPDGREGLDMVLTGRSVLVRDLLDNMPDTEEWFPDEPTLKDRNMRNGAGQVRVLSRLALKDAIENDRLGLLDQAIQDLHVPTKDVTDVSFYITIVSSFAGGTGSGMFISLALYIRQVLERYGTHAIIDGVFALPEIFEGNDSSDDQIESMYANTFAALKELVNISRVCLSKNAKVNEIIMQYQAGGRSLFDSETDRTDANNPPMMKKPFDMMFLFDRVTSNRNVLTGGADEYLSAMAQAVFMRCFAPVIQNSVRSAEDNLVVSWIQANNENRFGSMGTAKMIYPYQDIARYCELRTNLTIFGDAWKAPDEWYERIHREEIIKRRKNPSSLVHTRGELFTQWVEQQIADLHSPYGYLREAIQLGEVRKGEAKVSCVKVDDYLKDLDKDILEKAKAVVPDQDTHSVDLFGKEAYKKQSAAKKLDDAFENVVNCYNKINREFETTAGLYLDQVFPLDAEQMSEEASDGSVKLANLLMIEKKAVHPLAARYLLYKLRGQLQDKKNEYEDMALEKGTSIYDCYLNKDWNEPEEGIQRKPSEGLPKGKKWLENLEWASPLLNASVKRATGKMVTTTKTAMIDLNEYRDATLKKYVYEGLLRLVDQLILSYEKLFGVLTDLAKEIKQEVKQLENQHASFGMTQYVCATKNDKERVFKQIVLPLETGADNPIYSAIWNNMLDFTVKDIKRKQSNLYDKSTEKEENAKETHALKRLFKTQILPETSRRMREETSNQEMLGKDILQALNVEAERRVRTDFEKKGVYDDPTRDEIRQERIKIIKDVIGRAAPFLNYSSQNEGTLSVTYWGINKTVGDSYGEAAVKDMLNDGSTKTPAVAYNNSYPENEIAVYRSVLGLMVSNVRQFVDYGPAHGEYYERYEKRLNRITGGYYAEALNAATSVTPHVDKRWDKREYLQPLSEERDTEDRVNAARAMWLGVIFEKFRLARNGIEVQIDGAWEPVLYRGSSIRNWNGSPELYRALLEDSRIKAKLLSQLNARFKAEAKSMGFGTNIIGADANPICMRLIDEKNKQKPKDGQNLLTLQKKI